MPTVKETVDERFGFCEKKGDDCLCLKCPGEKMNCYHSCNSCDETTQILERLEKTQTHNIIDKKEFEEMKNRFRRNCSPLKECPLRDDLEKAGVF